MHRFRPAEPPHIDAVLAMMARYYAEDGYPFEEAVARDALEQLATDPSLGCLWVAQDADVVVGYLAVTLGFSLEYGGRDAFVDELFIHEDARGQGLGTAALAVAEDWCRGNGVRALHLEVEHGRERAHALYERMGFRAHPRHLMTKTVDEHPQR